MTGFAAILGACGGAGIRFLCFGSLGAGIGFSIGVLAGQAVSNTQDNRNYGPWDNVKGGYAPFNLQRNKENNGAPGIRPSFRYR